MSSILFFSRKKCHISISISYGIVKLSNCWGGKTGFAVMRPSGELGRHADAITTPLAMDYHGALGDMHRDACTADFGRLRCCDGKIDAMLTSHCSLSLNCMVKRCLKRSEPASIHRRRQTATRAFSKNEHEACM